MHSKCGAEPVGVSLSPPGSESLDLHASLEDARQENRRLAEKERQLQASLDQSEEQLRALQTENSSLLSKLQRLATEEGSALL